MLQPNTLYYVRIWTKKSAGWYYSDSTFQTGTGTARLVTPANASNLDPSVPIQFTWTPVAGALSYQLWIGTYPGGSDAFSQATQNTSAVAILAASTTYYARTWTEKSNGWSYTDTTFQTSAGISRLLAPANNASGIDPYQVQFSWTAVSDALAYTLYIGSSAGAKEVYVSGEVTATAKTVTLQPNSFYYVRIWTKKADGWYYSDTGFQTAAAVSNLICPAAGAVNIDPSLPVQFSWTPANGAISYSLWVGTSFGAKDAYTNVGMSGTATSVTLAPNTTYYARIWTQTAAGWLYTDTTFQTSAGISRLISPAGNATGLDPYQVQFNWTGVSDALAYTLYIGTSVGAKNVYGSGEVTATSVSLTLQPNTTYYARIWTKKSSTWYYSDSSFQTGVGPSHLISPAPNSTVIDSNVPTLFTWSSVIDVISYTLSVGTAPGKNDIYAGSEVVTTSASVQLPAGTTCYIRLWTSRPSGWFYVDSVVTTGLGLAHLITPANGSATTNPFPAQFNWKSVPDAVSYTLYIGTSIGAKDVYTSGEVQATTKNVTLQPNVLYYVRLWTRKASGWYFVDSTFQTGNNIAWINSPANNTTNVDPSVPVPVSWNAVPNAIAYS